MIRYNVGILNDQTQVCEQTQTFSDEWEAVDFMQKLKLEADAMKAGLRPPREGDVVDVEQVDDGFEVTEIVQLFPSFSEWGCPTCKGANDHCPHCAGEGWSPDTNGAGCFICTVVMKHGTMHMLCRTRYYNEIEEKEHLDA